jgi:hypothetical protein
LYEDDALREKYFAAIRRYQDAAVDEPTEQHQRLQELETCQRELLRCLRSQARTEHRRRRRSTEPPIATIPFSWRLHFGHVFHDRGGFDVVIANPPYVRIQNIDKESRAVYAARWATLNSGSADLYFAFIELAMDLAAEGGEIAYIMPNVSRTDAAAALRGLFDKSVTIRRWVDFDDTQVFPTSTTFVVLLFASKQKRTQETFSCSCVRDKSWVEQATSDWIYRKNLASDNLVDVTYTGRKWVTIPGEEARAVERMLSDSRPLAELVDIGVGIQTSADDIYLFDSWEAVEGGKIAVFSRRQARRYTIERKLLRKCIKGARATSDSGRSFFVLWPYDACGNPLSSSELRRRFPLGWKYLQHVKAPLSGREKGKFNDDEWYRFGRDQGIENCTKVKLIIPAILNGMRVIEDLKGRLAYTASGEGGGGAWGLFPKSPDVDLRKLADYLRSDEVWIYCKAMGFPKKGGWRGVDKTVLEPLPVPRSLFG